MNDAGVPRTSADFSALHRAANLADYPSRSALDRFMRESCEADQATLRSLVAGTAKLRRAVSAKDLRTYVSAFSKLPLWLQDESFESTGNPGEAAALLVEQALRTGLRVPVLSKPAQTKVHQLSLFETASIGSPTPSASSERNLSDWILWSESLARLTEAERMGEVISAWFQLGLKERLFLNRILTAELKIQPVATDSFQMPAAQASNTPNQDASAEARFVLLYAQVEGGRSAGILNELTLGVQNGTTFNTVAKVRADLDIAQLREIDQWIRDNTLERFGPVRTVPAAQVFRVRYERAQASTRHRSGFVLINPVLIGWERDVPLAEVCSAESLVN